MPGITNPAEEYFKDGLWAWDPAGGVWLKLIIDPLTNRLVIDHPGDLEVVQPTAADLNVANHGWDGSTWHKQPMGWGYSERHAQYITGAAVGAGDAQADTTAVPAGYVWVIEAIYLAHNAGANKRVYSWITDGAAVIYIFDDAAVVPGINYPLDKKLVLAEGDQLKATCVAPGDGKVLLLGVWGYRMKIAE